MFAVVLLVVELSTTVDTIEDFVSISNNWFLTGIISFEFGITEIFNDLAVTSPSEEIIIGLIKTIPLV